MVTQMVYQNPQATMPLKYGLDVLCNTDDDVILSNVLTNSRKVKTWAKSQPVNDRTLLICGSGPSIRDDVELIRQMQKDGCDVWALNNCANYLSLQDITPDVQVIMDAQECTIKAIGPAKAHWFASQVHPKLFEVVQDAVLWQATHGDIKVDEQEGFPEHDDEYCMIGSAVSVGNTAMVLAFAQGYRNIHLFGYDSSNKGVSHVIHQPWNDGEPMIDRTFRGKTYTSSLTMNAQTDAFPSRASVLQRYGCKLTVHGYGILPDRWNANLTEEEKYAVMWDRGDYGDVSPGELLAKRFIEIVKPEYGSRIADFGCGSGKGSLAINELGNFDLTLIDLVANSRVPEAERFKFILSDLYSLPEMHVDYGFCTDVMEHLPTDRVWVTLEAIRNSCSECFFQISTIQDDFGGAVGVPLHLTVKPYEWWKETLLDVGFTIFWSEEAADHVLFHVSPRFLYRR